MGDEGDEARIREWKLQLQRELAEDEDDEEEEDGQAGLISRHPMPAPVHFDDDPLSDEESGGGFLPAGAHAVDDDFGLDLEEPAYRDKAPAHPTAFELPKGVPKPRDGYADPAAIVTQTHLDAMQAALNERDIEIQRLRRVASTDPEGSSGRPDDLRDQRLRELAKKNRQLVQIVGKERAQNAVLAGELASLKASHSSQQPPPPQQQAAAGCTTRPASSASAARTSQVAAANAPLGGSDDARELRAKLASANSKLNELRQTEQAMRAELTKYQRALAKEVGEDVPLAKVVDEAGGWRGRAQQITLLKAKLAELRRSASAAGVGGGEATNAVDERARTQIASKEQERRREFERLVLREQELHSEKAELATRLEATQARVKILETEGRALREKLKLLLGKSDDDDELIQALKEQLTKASEQGARRGSPQSRRGAAESAASAAALAELSAAKEELAQQCDRQEQIIIFLRDQLSRQSVLKESETPPAASPHDLRVLETENAKLRELCQLLQDKLSRAVASQPTRPPTE